MALFVDQSSVVEEPSGIVVGVAVKKLKVGAGVGTVTATVAL